MQRCKQAREGAHKVILFPNFHPRFPTPDTHPGVSCSLEDGVTSTAGPTESIGGVLIEPWKCVTDSPVPLTQ